MNKKKAATALAFFAAAGGLLGTSLSAKPAQLHEKQSVTINAPADVVWQGVGQFSDLTWVPAVKESVADNGNAPGSHRTLDFGGAKMTETLVSHDAAHRRYTYVIDDTEANHAIAPVRGVRATISVRPGPSNTSILTWEANFRRLDESDQPAEGANDVAAQKQISSVFGMGLNGAKEKFGAK